MKVLENAGRFDAAKGTARAWLLGCARHVVIDRLRAEKRRSDEVPEQATTADYELQRPQRAEARTAARGDCRASARVSRGARSLRARRAAIRRGRDGARLPGRHGAVAASSRARSVDRVFARGRARAGKRRRAHRTESDGGLFVSEPIRDRRIVERRARRAALGAARGSSAGRRDGAAERGARARCRARGKPWTDQARPTIVGRARVADPRRALAFALAAAAAVAGVAVLVALRAEWTLRAERVERAEQVEQAARVAASSRAGDAVTAVRAAAAAPDVRPAFRPIAFSRGLSTSESYSVVRVRIELVSSAPGAGAPNASIEADLLVGEDGLAHAIRFDSADTLPVYAAVRSVSGERR